MEHILHNQIIIYPSQSKTHLQVPFQLDKVYASLVLSFSYSPSTVSTSRCKELFKSYNYFETQEVKYTDDLDEPPTIFQFITASIEYNGCYLGSYHNHANGQTIRIERNNPSNGFMKFQPEIGDWMLQFHCHCIEERTILQFSIEGEVANQKLNFFSIEMHSHTQHSDGMLTTKELYKKIKKEKIDSLLITDHNVSFAYEELQNCTPAMPSLPAVEWTTFWGHLLVIDAGQAIDWRLASQATIDSCLHDIQANQGIVGIAHPFSEGYPFCTGCRFEYSISDWSQVNFIEIWNGMNPLDNEASDLNYRLWRDKLSQGYHIGVSAGRDIHGHTNMQDLYGITYLGRWINEDENKKKINRLDIKQALRKGRQYISVYPKIAITLSKKNKKFTIGDSISPGNYELSFTLIEPEILYGEKIQCIVRKLTIIHNEQIDEFSIEDSELKQDITLKDGYVFFELSGDINHLKNEKLLITSPIYIDRD